MNYFFDNPKCKECGNTMDLINENESCHGSSYIFWCEICGTLVDFYSSLREPNPEPDDWRVPGT
jgi:hypothetical protein